MSLERTGWRLLSELDHHTGVSCLTADARNAILSYHSVSDRESDLFGNVSTDRFRRDLAYLRENYEIVDLPAVTTDVRDGPKKVAITFDDGYKNFHSTALPILEQFDAPATVFVNPDFLGDANRDRIESAHSIAGRDAEIIMDERQVRDLVNGDLITVGNHTLTHPDLTAVDNAEELRAEIVESKEKLERAFEITVDRFCYPYGRYNRQTVDVVRESHEFAVVTTNGLVDPESDRCLLQRIGAHRHERTVRWDLTDLSQRIKRAYGRLSLEIP